MISSISARQGLLFCALFSAAALALALIGQYGFSLHPCDLCIMQRYPYAAVMLVGGVGWFLAKSRSLQRALLLLCALLFALDAGIAFYHTGVEYGWFPGPDACSSEAKPGQTLEEMRAAIMGAPLVTCAQAMAYIFGLSMAAWNALAAAAAAMAAFVAWRKTK